MFERFFLWAMRHGARVLFAIGLAYLALGLLNSVLTLTMMSRAPSGLVERSSVFLFATGLFGTLTTSGMLLFGALVIDRLDRWLSNRTPA